MCRVLVGYREAVYGPTGPVQYRGGRQKRVVSQWPNTCAVGRGSAEELVLGRPQRTWCRVYPDIDSVALSARPDGARESFCTESASECCGRADTHLARSTVYTSVIVARCPKFEVRHSFSVPLLWLSLRSSETTQVSKRRLVGSSKIHACCILVVLRAPPGARRE